MRGIRQGHFFLTANLQIEKHCVLEKIVIDPIDSWEHRKSKVGQSGAITGFKV